MRHLFLSLVVIASLPLSVAHASAQDQPEAAGGRLQSEASLHPAATTYRVSLLPNSTQKFVSAEGTFTDESALSCEGWNVSQRLFVKFMPSPVRQAGRSVHPVLPVYLRTGANIFESLDGLYYRFEDKSSMAGQIISSHKGEARLSAPGQSGLANFVEPEEKTMELPAGTIFPVGYAAQLMMAAGQGQPRYESVVFDGSMSAELGLLRMSTVIATPRAATFKQDRIVSMDPNEREFTTQLAWPMRTNIFKVGGTDGARPVFQQGITMLPNGRAETMLMDFGDFKLRFDLQKFEELPTPTCP